MNKRKVMFELLMKTDSFATGKGGGGLNLGQEQ